MKELLKKHKEITEEIFNKFGIEIGYGYIEDKTDVKWNSVEDIYWIENDDIYNNTVLRDPVYFENFVLFFIEDSSGNEYYQIYDINLRDDNLEEID